jgi:hypothetical protein
MVEIDCLPSWDSTPYNDYIQRTPIPDPLIHPAVRKALAADRYEPNLANVLAYFVKPTVPLPESPTSHRFAHRLAVPLSSSQ